MQTARSAAALSSIIGEWKKEGRRIAFVPTMGALHEGHLSLIEIAKQHGDRIAVSIFVNPTQFAPHEDFSAYPRDEAADLKKLEAAGADLVYIPPQSDIYPVVATSDVKAGSAAKGLEGDIRPTHFDGVVTVVSRLFRQVQPDAAVFGEKDYQQLQVIRDMVAAQDLNIEIIPAPIVRDAQGLALSSRNAYLSPKQLETARKLNKILADANRNDLEAAKKKLLAAGFDEVQYLEKRWGRLLAAVKLGKLRLIDNVAV
jgi:pantoate--beta-alanine ligase